VFLLRTALFVVMFHFLDHIRVLCKMCIAYADCGLFDLIYLTCSLYFVFMPLPICPIYTILHVLHFTL